MCTLNDSLFWSWGLRRVFENSDTRIYESNERDSAREWGGGGVVFTAPLFGVGRWSDIDKGKLREKRAPVPLCPPQMAHGLAWKRTIASAVRGLLLNAGRIRIVFGNVGVISDDSICCLWKWMSSDGRMSRRERSYSVRHPQNAQTRSLNHFTSTTAT